MRQEWIERAHDQARMEMGYCVQDGRIWCSSHDSGKVPGAESCNKMDEAYRIAESAGEVVEELARADEQERIAQAIEAVAAGWVQYQRMPENTTHIAYVHESGAVYDPERGWLSSEDALLDHADPLISRDDAAAIARRDT